MSGPDSALAGVFVTRRGDAWATGIAAGLGGAVGAVAGSALAKRADGDAESLARGALGYLAVLPDSVAVFKAKRGAFKPKATEEVLFQVPRSELKASRYKKGTVVGVIELEFTDGSTWAFDVGRAFAKGATNVATTLGATLD